MPKNKVIRIVWLVLVILAGLGMILFLVAPGLYY